MTFTREQDAELAMIERKLVETSGTDFAVADLSTPESIRKHINLLVNAGHDRKLIEEALKKKGKQIPNDQFMKASKVFSPKIQLAEKFFDMQPIYYDESQNWWLWNEPSKSWKMIDEVTLTNHLYLSAGYDTIQAKERNEILQALKQVGRMYRPREIKPTWIQFKDKIVDVITGEEIEATAEYFAVNPIPYPLHQERYVETPNMDRIFEEWVGKEHVKKLYQMIAYCLLPDYPIHRLFCLIGGGMNGKSCFLKIIEKFIGQDNCCSTELDTLLNSRFEVTRLNKKLVCIMGETNFNQISKTSILKKLTGQDIIGFEYKGKTPFEGRNYAKIMIATNNLPETTDKTIGFYRRWLIIDFPNQFNESKDIMLDIPEEEFEILAVKSVLILKDLLRDRKFDNEGSIEQRIQKYESKSNFLDQFIKEFLVEDVNGYITKADFYKKFISWCKENRHRELSETSVGLEMKKKDIKDGAKHFDWLFDGRGGYARIWEGVKWK